MNKRSQAVPFPGRSNPGDETRVVEVLAIPKRMLLDTNVLPINVPVGIAIAKDRHVTAAEVRRVDLGKAVRYEWRGKKTWNE